MKLKKLLAGVTAAAMAIGLVAVSSLTASAAVDTTVTVNTSYDYLSAIVIETNGDYSVNNQDVTCASYWTQVDRQSKNEEGKDIDNDYTAAFGASSEDGSTQKITFKADSSLGTIKVNFIIWDNTSSKNIGHTVNIDLSKAENSVLNVQLIPKGDIATTITNNWWYAQEAEVKYLSQDTTVYTSKPYDADGELDKPSNVAFYGTWDLSKAVGPNARVEFIFEDDNCSNGFALCDGNVDKWWIEPKLKGTKDKTSFKISEIKAAGFSEPLKIYVNGWTDDTIATGIIVYNGSDDELYTPAVADVPVESVTITGAPTEAMKIGETATLTATLTPADATVKTVTWTSSNTKVATVDENGKVTAKAAGEATITATAGTKTATAKVTVEAAIIPVTAEIATTEVTVYSNTASAQAVEVEKNLDVTVKMADGTVIPAINYSVKATVDLAATEGNASTANVTVELNDTGKARYSLTGGTASVAVKFAKKQAAIYQGYTITPATLDTVVVDDKEKILGTILSEAEKQFRLTLKGAPGYDDFEYGRMGTTLAIQTSVLKDDGSYDIGFVIHMALLRYENDIYVSEGKEITLGDSREVSDIVERFTINVKVQLPEEPEDPTPVDPNPVDPTPVDPTPVDPTPVDPTPVDPTPVDPTPVDPAPVDPTPSAPDAPIAIGAASVPRVGDAVVSTDVNTGAAFTGTRAMEEVSRAKSGDVINIVMTPGMSEGEIIAKIAYKKNVTVNLKYSAYSVSINSDDVAENFEAKGFYSTARFLSADEKAAFAGAKELRQICVKNLDGVEKATITVTMRGGSKGMSATALLRTSAGKYKTVGTGKVADDRTFSFEITRAGNYVVYAGNIDMD